MLGWVGSFGLKSQTKNLNRLEKSLNWRICQYSIFRSHRSSNCNFLLFSLLSPYMRPHKGMNVSAASQMAEPSFWKKVPNFENGISPIKKVSSDFLLVDSEPWNKPLETYLLHIHTIFTSGELGFAHFGPGYFSKSRNSTNLLQIQGISRKLHFFPKFELRFQT